MTTSVHVDSPTEGRNPATVDIDRLPTAEVLRLVIAEERPCRPRWRPRCRS